MSQDLIKAIRANNLPEIESLLTLDEQLAQLNQKFSLEQVDIDLVRKKQPELPPTRFNLLISPCTPLFYAALYGNFDIFKLLLEKGADPKIRNGSEVNLHMFGMGMGAYSRFKGYFRNEIIDKDSDNNPFFLAEFEENGQKNTRSIIICHSTADQLEDLIDAVSENHSSNFNKCLANNVHQFDHKGNALYAALFLGRREMIEKLVELQAPVNRRHFFAAGRGPQATSSAFYEMIRPNQYSRAESTLLSEKSRELYHALYKGEYNLSYQILEDNPQLNIEPRHYYAAGRSAYSEQPSYSSRLYDLLKYREENKCLPPNLLCYSLKGRLNLVAIN